MASGQRAAQHKQAGHKAAPTSSASPSKNPCQQGAVHTWLLADSFAKGDLCLLWMIQNFRKWPFRQSRLRFGPDRLAGLGHDYCFLKFLTLAGVLPEALAIFCRQLMKSKKRSGNQSL